MLDVHPPHEAAHTWKDFFIHIATICVGLLIAIGLEQTVEAIHRHKERVDLRESLAHESEQIIRDCARVEASFTAELEWESSVRGKLIEAAATRKPLGVIPPFPHSDFDEPDDPIFKAAKAGDKFLLLTEQEAADYNELDGLLIYADHAYEQRVAAENLAIETWGQFDFDQPVFHTNPHRPVSFSHAYDGLTGLTLGSDQLRQLHRDLVHAQMAANGFRYWCRQTRGAALALSHGDHDLRKIEAAERQFDNVP